jgi:signal transduction histidine kinase
VCWGLALTLAGELGVRLSLPDRPLALVALSAGIAVLWISLSTRRTLPYDLAVLVVAQAFLSARLDLPAPLVAFGPVVSLAQVATFVLLLRRWRPDLVPFGGTRREWRLADLEAFLAAAVLAAVVTAVLSTGSQAVAGLPSGDLSALLVRWGRTTCTIVAVASLGLLLVARWSGAAPRRLRLDPARVVEGVALVATTVALYLVCFAWLEALPLSFVLLVGTAWAGIRFAPVAAAAHGLFSGALAVGFTLAGHGVFATIVDDPAERAVVAQLFVLIASATGLTLSVARAQLATAERLAASRLQLIDQVLREVDDGIVVVREDGDVLVMNPAGRRLMGLTEGLEHVVPAETFLLYEADGSRVTTERAPYARALRGERVDGDELELRREDGSVLRYLRTNAELLPALEPDAAPRVLVTYHDVTADRMRQDALATFAGHVAHDLRNPLAVVEAWNEILEESFRAGESVSADEGQAITRRIAGAAVRMRDFIQALLDYTIARDRELKRAPVDLVAVATDVAEARSQPVDGGPVPVIRVVGAGCALADAQLLRMVLDNLVANAVKYVAPGVRPDVLVTVEQARGKVELRVSDNGIGIPLEHRDRVFSAFHRVAAHEAEGSGLGLGISQRIVERHGGSIAVEDSVAGTVVRVTLPHALPQRALEAAVGDPSGAAPQPA